MASRALTRRGAPALARVRRLAVLALVLGWLAPWPVQAHDGTGPDLERAGAPRAGDPSAEWLTRRLVALNASYQLGGPSERARLHGPLVRLALARRERLLALAEHDPAAVVRVAIPDPIRASLPGPARDAVERETIEEGDLEVLHEDRDDGSRYLHFLHTAGGERLALHFAGPAPALPTGTRVRVRGIRVGGALAVGGGSGHVQAVAAPAPGALGEQRTLVILVNFADQPVEPYTPAQASGVVFDTTSAYDLEGSYGQTWLTGAVVGWFTLALGSTVCDYATLASQARQAAAASGVDPAAYGRLVYAFPRNACGWWGLGSIGGNPSQAWINGTLALGVAAHEMGHNLGLWHSHAWECGTAVLGPACASIEYGDTLDMMGGSYSAHYNAFQKERLGWLGAGASPPVTTVQGDGAYALEPYETEGVGPKALKVLKGVDPSGRRTWYYVELRRPIGFDASLGSSANVMGGVVIHTGTEGQGDSSQLLDMTPETASWADPALVVGRSFADPASGLTLTPLAATSEGGLVAVTLGGAACVPASPDVTLSPASQWAAPGTPASYTLTVTSRDSLACPAATFVLGATGPGGWGTALGSPALSLAPGQTGATTLQVTSAAGSPEGFYDVAASAAAGGAPAPAGLASAVYVVTAGLDVALATDRAAYTRAQTVVATATVAAGGAPVAGTTVTFRIARPGGTTTTGTAITGADGRAGWSYRLNKRRDPPGSYVITAEATLNGALDGSAATSFLVQ